MTKETKLPIRPAGCRSTFRRCRLASLIAAGVCLQLLRSSPVRAADWSEPAPLAAQSLLLAGVNSGSHLIAVGDHGDVVISSDGGRSWTQSPAPTRALLTSVSFPDTRNGWAVGHQGVILHTDDAGLTWQRQDDGTHSADIYLSVLFLDSKRGFIAGAYGRFLATQNGGQTWVTSRPTTDEVHFNRISAGPDGWLYLSGESATTLVSTDAGTTWRKLTVPYDGSLFGVLPLDQGRLITYGLRGHILRSDDHGATWSPETSDEPVLIMGGIRCRNDTVVLAGQGGHFFLSHDTGRTFTPWKPAGFDTSVADLVETDDNAIVTFGEAGAVRLILP